MSNCQYTPCYSSSKCNLVCEDHESFCTSHNGKKCVSCGNQATNECNHTGQFVCGVPLCDECIGIVGKENSTSTWGFIGHKHIKKDQLNNI